jgi:hypothetical protein
VTRCATEPSAVGSWSAWSSPTAPPAVCRGNHGRFLRLRDNRVGTRSNGNLVVENNRTATRLRSNRASNHLVCRANRTIEGSGNRAAGGMRNQCANLR